MPPMLIAVIQMGSSAHKEHNLAQAKELLQSARDGGAGMAVLPEHFASIRDPHSLSMDPQPLKGPLVQWLGRQAQELGLWIVGGSFARLAPGHARVYNTCPLMDPQGRLVAYYDKIHLFDLGPPGHPALRESAQVRPGRRVVLAETPAGCLGLSICYDLRFPELYRRLRLKGAQILAAPSAFTVATGKAHWELLVRARAVENACYVLAAAQQGQHGGRRASFGQAMIVDPWGDILAQCPPGPGLALAQVEPRRVESSRRKLDSFSHARLLPRAWGSGERP